MNKNIYYIKIMSYLVKNIDVCLLIVILIGKHAFFKPTKFFCKNLLEQSFTYDGTLHSCKKSEKINDPIFHKVQKTRFLAVFWPKFAPKIFFSKIGLRHILTITILHLCTKNEKIPMIQS